MSAAQILGVYAVAVAYLAALLGPLWPMGDTLLWIAEQRRLQRPAQ